MRRGVEKGEKRESQNKEGTRDEDGGGGHGRSRHVCKKNNYLVEWRVVCSSFCLQFGIWTQNEEVGLTERDDLMACDSERIPSVTAVDESDNAARAVEACHLRVHLQWNRSTLTVVKMG